jgi:hypothetical protein
VSEPKPVPYPDWSDAPAKGPEGLMKHLWHSVESANERNLELEGLEPVIEEPARQYIPAQGIQLGTINLVCQECKNPQMALISHPAGSDDKYSWPEVLQVWCPKCHSAWIVKEDQIANFKAQV